MQTFRITLLFTLTVVATIALGSKAPNTGVFPVFTIATVDAQNNKKDSKTPKHESKPENHPKGYSGKALEVIDASEYTYVFVDMGGKNIWIAAPKTEVKTGDRILFLKGAPMVNFRSNTLNRTFPVVYFVSFIAVPGSQKPGANTNQTPAMGKNPHAANNQVFPQVDLSGMKKAKGGQTLEEIFAKKSKLAGRKVLVRGKVVKISPSTFGKNWFHLRDGTGAKGDNDITVLTDGTVNVGDKVLVSGTLVLNKDFGYNIKLDILIENAKIKIE